MAEHPGAVAPGRVAVVTGAASAIGPGQAEADGLVRVERAGPAGHVVIAEAEYAGALAAVGGWAVTEHAGVGSPEVAVNGRKAEEVAQQFGLTRNQVYLARSRIRHRLKSELDGLLEAALDDALRRAIADWLTSDAWPFERPLYAPLLT